MIFIFLLSVTSEWHHGADTPADTPVGTGAKTLHQGKSESYKKHKVIIAYMTPNSCIAHCLPELLSWS